LSYSQIRAGRWGLRATAPARGAGTVALCACHLPRNVTTPFCSVCLQEGAGIPGHPAGSKARGPEAGPGVAAKASVGLSGVLCCAAHVMERGTVCTQRQRCPRCKPGGRMRTPRPNSLHRPAQLPVPEAASVQ
jgi:hypothetical protein